MLMLFMIVPIPGRSATTTTLTENGKIDLLIQFVEKSGFAFERNGKEYSSKDAAKHLRDKRQNAGNRIKTAREFIEYVASKSSMSGKEYRIRNETGKMVPVKPWLEAELARLEGKTAAPKQKLR